MKPYIKDLYLTDGGLETTLIFEKNLELRHFAAFELMTHASGRQVITEYFKPYLEAAREAGLPFVLETPTWRLNPDWGYKMGYTIDEQRALNSQGVKLMRDTADEYGLADAVVSGCIGPRGDGYISGEKMTAREAGTYHNEQIRSFTRADADVVTAMTLTYVEEAIGIVLAARKYGIPAVISFTLETDGKLPSGESLEEAINRTDHETGGYAVHYMINCAHPTHFSQLFDQRAKWQERIGGIRANASCKSHEELDNSTELDKGDPHQFGQDYAQLLNRLPWLKVLGGCCGTDHQHIREICSAQTV